MFELIWWFIFKDSRVPFVRIRNNSTPILACVSLINFCLSAIFFANIEKSSQNSRTLQLQYIKFSWEIFNAIFMMPFLVYKSYKKFNFNPENRREQYNLALYLRSRILERALGISVPGLVMIIFGFFNVFWALATLLNLKALEHLTPKALQVVQVFMTVDLAAFVILVVFSTFVLTVKIRGVYQGTVNLKRILQKKISLG